jgi:hypothetical protein
MADERNWRAAVADMKKYFDQVIEIGDPELAHYVAARIWDCILEYQAGEMPEASRATAMRLTPHFSVIKANGAFLHDEGMNLPLQEEDSDECFES